MCSLVLLLSFVTAIDITYPQRALQVPSPRLNIALVEGARLLRSCSTRLASLQPHLSSKSTCAPASQNATTASLGSREEMTRSKQTERATESQSPPTDDSDGYIDEGLAESRRKIARKQPKWLDKMTKEAEADRVAFSERVAEILEQAYACMSYSFVDLEWLIN